MRVSQDGIGSFISSQMSEMFDGERKIWMCLMCEKTCNVKRDLGRHIEALHVLTDPFICGLCNGHFGTRRALQRHNLAYHTGK